MTDLLASHFERVHFLPDGGMLPSSDDGRKKWLEDFCRNLALAPYPVYIDQAESISAAASLEPLPFDSDLYGIKMAKIGFLTAEGDYLQAKSRQANLLHQIFEGCQKEGYVHLSARAYPDQLSLIHLYEEMGFYMVAGLATYCLNLRQYECLNSVKGLLVRPFQQKDIEPLCEISRVAFGDPKDWLDKAHADPNLPKDKSDELYVRWFRNCCNGTQADQVLVAEVEGKPVGYIALKLEKGNLEKLGLKVGSIPLNAVDKAYRRQGIYSALVQEGLKWFAPRVDWVTIKTQVTTMGVHKTWTKLGATMRQVEYVFHKYFGFC